MQTPSLVEGLLADVDGRLQPHAFRRKRQDFYRDVPVGQWLLHLSIIRHPSDFDATIDVGLRYTRVEDLVRLAEEASSGKDRNRVTVGAELGNLADRRPRRFTVERLSDIGGVGADIERAFETVGRPYLERCSDLEELDRVLTQGGPDVWLYSPIPTARARRVLVIALLLRGEAGLSAAFEQQREMLRSEGHDEVARFTAFAERLRNHAGAGPQGLA